MPELHPYGEPQVRLSTVTEPVIGFLSAYYKDPYLVLGNIHWDNGVPELANITKPYYQKITRWIREHWQKQGNFYYGPGAQKLIEDGAKTVNVLPCKAEFKVIEY